ncbi:MAG: FhaA domain-containing protein, partial [Aquiluna sp.]
TYLTHSDISKVGEMGLLDKAEQRIEGAVSSLFSKLSRAELQPVEITQAIRSAMDLAAKADTAGSTVVPHRYLLLVHSSDAQKITASMLSAIRAEVAKYASSRQYRLVD